MSCKICKKLKECVDYETCKLTRKALKQEKKDFIEEVKNKPFYQVEKLIKINFGGSHKCPYFRRLLDEDVPVKIYDIDWIRPRMPVGKREKGEWREIPFSAFNGKYDNV